MKKDIIRISMLSLLSIMILILPSCSDKNVKNNTKQKELLSEAITKLCTAPDEKLQKAYKKAKDDAQKAASETTEPGVYGIYDYDELLQNMYGSYFSEQGTESIPYWIYTNLTTYASDQNVTVSVQEVTITPEESSEGNYYSFTAQLEYCIDENKYSFGQKGTALFQDEKIQNIYFEEGLMEEIENRLFVK